VTNSKYAILKIVNKTFVFSLGGSLIHTSKGLNFTFLRQFNSFIRTKTTKKFHFGIICGGGHICREYQEAARQLNPKHASEEDIDWIGIRATWLNAQLIWTMFRDLAYPKIITEYKSKFPELGKYPVLVGGGEDPRLSSDFDAVLVSQIYQTNTIINLTNVDGVYNRDPQSSPGVKIIEHLSWDEMIKIVGTTWQPGLNTPFDPVASQRAKELGIKVIICNGQDLENLDNILEGKKFTGTVIE
jgi:uridylate kinase